jgi:hypothetical protein
MSSTLEDIEDFPDVSDMMASKYLGADMVEGEETVTITHVCSATETFEAGRADRVNVITLKRSDGSQAQMLFCKTNIAACRVLLGDSTKAWVGKRVVLVADEDKMKGELVNCIRIRTSPDSQPGRVNAYEQAWNHPDGRMNGIKKKTSLVVRLKKIISRMKKAKAAAPAQPAPEPTPEQKQAVEDLGKPLLDSDEPLPGEGG